MTELPKSVRQRLLENTAGDSGAHPDADLLAAFQERSLADDDRQRVLTHLAQCGLCREVLALALPPVAAAAAVPAPARRRWLAPPMLFRWGAAVAAVVVVSAALWLHRPAAIHPTSDGQFAKVSNPATPGAGGSEAAPAASKGPLPAMPSVAAPPEHSRVMAKRAAPAEPHREAAVAGRAAQDSPANGGRQSENRDEFRAAAAPPPPATAPGAVVGGLAGRPAGANASADAASAGGAKYATAQAARSETMARERTADESAMAALAPRAAVRAEERAPVAKALKGAPAPWFWSISPEGKLQRSADQLSWQTVEVAAGVSFRSLARTGSQLWAGGSGGALYHSSDNGASWQRVALPGLSAADTVSHIDFPTPLNGSVASQSGRWSTTDGGRTWAKD